LTGLEREWNAAMSESTDRPTLFCFGLGYSARRLAGHLAADGWRIVGTCRDAEAGDALAADGITAWRFDGGAPAPGIVPALAGATHVLSSVPPDADGDPVLRHHGADLADAGGLVWVGYLSTTGVYGDTGGAVVDETSRLDPTSARGRRRVAAEAAWLALAAEVPVHVFRLAGIYGPGRSVLDRVRAGTARRIDRPGHRFGRIHVDDIARVLRASMAHPEPGAVYNVCDDAPAPPADVVAEAAALLGRPPPPLVPFDEAARTMSPMALGFWRDNRMVDNRRLKEGLGVYLEYPDYKAGLAAILAEEEAAPAL
jgi:nucleoside-diphosphate-sugar epimerase